MKLTYRELSVINSAVNRLKVDYKHKGIERVEFIMPHSACDSPISNGDMPVDLTCNVSVACIDRCGEIEVDVRKN